MVGGENWQVAGGFERNMNSFSTTKGESMNPGPNAWYSQGKSQVDRLLNPKNKKTKNKINKTRNILIFKWNNKYIFQFNHLLK